MSLIRNGCRKKRLFLLLTLLVCGPLCHAQFDRSGPFTQQYNDTTVKEKRDTSDKLFSFNEYFGGLGHKRQTRIGTLAAGSALFVGGMQIYNKQYWKLPVIYGGLLAGFGGGTWTYLRYKASGDEWCKNAFPWFFAGGALMYWGTLLDGTICYHPDRKPLPGRATLYSLLCPGLGQIYNGEAWKVPVYWACLLGSVHFYVTNKTNYERYRWIYNQASDPETSASTPIAAETAKWYRDEYRRYRDYSMLALVGFYLLQVIDANVFSYLGDFEVNDNLAVRVQPSVISSYADYAGMDRVSGARPAYGYRPLIPDAYGLSLALRF